MATIFGVDSSRVQREIHLTYFIDPLLDAVDEYKRNLMCGVSISCYDEPTQSLMLRADDWKLTTVRMERLKKGCPLSGMLSADFARALSKSKAAIIQKKPDQSLSFKRKRVKPYLQKVRDDSKPGKTFLEFLAERFA